MKLNHWEFKQLIMAKRVIFDMENFDFTFFLEMGSGKFSEE